MCCARKAAAAASSESENNDKKKSSTSDLGAMVNAVDIAKSVSAAAFRKPAAFVPSYGTAGFRAEASLLDSTLFR